MRHHAQVAETSAALENERAASQAAREEAVSLRGELSSVQSELSQVQNMLAQERGQSEWGTLGAADLLHCWLWPDRMISLRG